MIKILGEILLIVVVLLTAIFVLVMFVIAVPVAIAICAFTFCPTLSAAYVLTREPDDTEERIRDFGKYINF